MAEGWRGPERNEPVGGATHVAMVRTAVTMEAVEAAPVAVGVTEAGVRMQVESIGAPAQVKATGVVKPLRPVTVTVMAAVLPAATLVIAGETARLKSGLEVMPVPVSAAVCGLLASLSVTVRVAVAAAAAVGVNVTLIVQVPAAGRLEAQVVVCEKDAEEVPARLTAMRVTVAELLLVRVTICAALVVLIN